MFRIGALMLMVLATGLAGCVSSCPPSHEDASGARRIAPGDVLNIVFWGEDDLSGLYEVAPDGRVTLPLFDPLPAAGLTPDAFEDAIQDQLCCFIRDPLITVEITTPAPRTEPASSCRPADRSQAAKAASDRLRQRLALQALRRRPPPQEPRPAP